jgi:phage I-like protein
MNIRPNTALASLTVELREPAGAFRILPAGLFRARDGARRASPDGL